MNALRILSKLPISPEKRLEWYPPFFLMRIKVLYLAKDWSRLTIKLPLTFFSKNMGQAMFGGYQAALADPIAALACARRFPGYSVWTRAMHIDFLREGSTDLQLRFDFSEQVHESIANDLQTKNRSTPVFEYGFYLEDGTQCSRVKNTVAIRPKGYKKPSNHQSDTQKRVEN